ncbi:hypothetical protein LTR94_027566, partial [Friedmanniomyces endolithicus]
MPQRYGDQRQGQQIDGERQPPSPGGEQAAQKQEEHASERRRRALQADDALSLLIGVERADQGEAGGAHAGDGRSERRTGDEERCEVGRVEADGARDGEGQGGNDQDPAGAESVDQRPDERRQQRDDQRRK